MNVVWLTAFNMPKKERYSKEKQEKIAAVAKGCRSITDIFGRLEYYDYTLQNRFCEYWFISLKMPEKYFLNNSVISSVLAS